MSAGPDARKQDLYHVPSALATPSPFYWSGFLAVRVRRPSQSLHTHVVHVTTIRRLTLIQEAKASRFYAMSTVGLSRPFNRSGKWAGQKSNTHEEYP